MRKTVLSFPLFLFSIIGYSQTEVSGGIYENTTWSPAGNPYIVSGNVVLFQDLVLTLEPGVLVKFNQGASLEIRGKLIAIGNSMDWITFTSNLHVPVMNSWEGIKVIGVDDSPGSENQVIMEYCSGNYARYFIDLHIAYHGPYVFKHCYFSNNYQVNKDGGLPYALFDYCTFDSNFLGLGYCQFDATVSHSFFINNVNGVEGFDLIDSCHFKGNTGIALFPAGITMDCLFENNHIAVSAGFNSVNTTFINNTITNNEVGVEIQGFYNGVNFTGNVICHNTSYNIRNLFLNNANLAYNCWCSTDSAYIRSTIYDGYVNTEYGLVKFIPVLAWCADMGVGIKPASNATDSSINIFPNPFNEELNVYLQADEEMQVKLIDVSGYTVYRQSFIHSINFNTDQLPQGMYMYEIRSKAKILHTGKVIKI